MPLGRYCTMLMGSSLQQHHSGPCSSTTFTCARSHFLRTFNQRCCVPKGSKGLPGLIGTHGAAMQSYSPARLLLQLFPQCC